MLKRLRESQLGSSELFTAEAAPGDGFVSSISKTS